SAIPGGRVLPSCRGDGGSSRVVRVRKRGLAATTPMATPTTSPMMPTTAARSSPCTVRSYTCGLGRYPVRACDTTEVLSSFTNSWPILQTQTGSIDAMRDTYHEDLDSLSERLVEMTRLARHAVARATTALLDSDLNAAQEVISGDEEINRLDQEIEVSAFDLMARQQPVATDLRAIITSLHMAGDLERMGDHAVHIAKIARRRHPDSAIPTELRSIVLE